MTLSVEKWTDLAQSISVFLCSVALGFFVVPAPGVALECSDGFLRHLVLVEETGVDLAQVELPVTALGDLVVSSGGHGTWKLEVLFETEEPRLVIETDYAKPGTSP